MERVKGFPDIIGKKAYNMWYISNKLIEISYRFGCELAILPLVETLSLFKRAVGAETDIVHKEMFVLEENCVLRPEITSSMVRALKDSGSYNGRYVYNGHCFRRERPQKGRYRQFTQFGVEFIGSKSIGEEMDILLFLKAIIEEFNIKDVLLKINFMGSSEDRQKYIIDLEKYFSNHINELSPEALDKFHRRSFLRMLDSKDSNEIIKNAPSILDYVNRDKFQELYDFAKKIELNVEIDTTIVRGLDYYNDFVFELVPIHNNSMQSSILGGGRYDGLFGHLGYQNTPGIGFAIGIDRLAEYICESTGDLWKKPINMGVCAQDNLIEYLPKWRKNMNIILLDSQVKNALKEANSKKINLVLLPIENDNTSVIIKNMNSGKQKIINFVDLQNINLVAEKFLEESQDNENTYKISNNTDINKLL